MPQSKPANPPKDWKPFRLANGTVRHLPEWADKPLNFHFDPEEALKRGAFSSPPKVQALKKSVLISGKSRR